MNTSAGRKNTTSWKCDTNAVGLDVVKCLIQGREKVLQYLSASDISTRDKLDVDRIIKDGSGVDMLHPYCRATSMCLLSGDCTQYDLVGTHLNDDEYEEVDDLVVSSEGGLL